MSKLKELHHRIRRTMIYVTHDQTEALTFADQVVVMKDGLIVQIGTPVELFERPRHTFVGHFIGSPGMNLLPCEIKAGQAFVGGHPVKTLKAGSRPAMEKNCELGVRPEFVSFAPQGIPVEVSKVADAGRFRIVETRHNGQAIKLLVPEGREIPTGRAHLRFDPAHTQVYENGWMID
jgi:glycerol transport system ATP-binding protein